MQITRTNGAWLREKKKGREEISTQILSESRRGSRARPRRPPPAEVSGSGGTVLPHPRPAALPGPTAPPRRGGKEEIQQASPGQWHGRSPLPQRPPGKSRSFAPSPSPHGPVPSAHGSGPPRPSVRPSPSAAGAGTGGWAEACAVPAKPRRSRSQSGPASPRSSSPRLSFPPSLLPSPAWPSACTHPPSFSLPGPRCVCAALPHAARRRPGGWVCGEGG